VPLTDGELAEALRAGGLRLTRPRREVYGALRDLGGHRSADEVAEAVRSRGAKVSRMTVYNALADLGRAGVILEADVGPGRALFEVGKAWHHHFVCRRCGAILDVPCRRGRKPCLDLPASVGRADEAQVVFRGVCRRCRP
jgi:Fe2+ or Zn2+ uptake regulation protein